MTIEREHIRLIKLTEDFIELVREKRNLPVIQKKMEYRLHITPEMQQTWFASINNDDNLYFLIEVNGIVVGLINGSGIDWKAGIVNNGGIFVWEEDYLRSPEVVQASILLTDLGFLAGIRKNYVRILSDNFASIAFNLSLGYQLMSGQLNVYNQRYELTEDNYITATRNIRRQSWFRSNVVIYLTQQEFDNVQFVEKITKMKNEHALYLKPDIRILG